MGRLVATGGACGLQVAQAQSKSWVNTTQSSQGVRMDATGMESLI